MATPILATKLYIPPPKPNSVNRPRLVKQLNECLKTGCRLTLISAPAGFGKTTLVSEWIADCGMPVAWFSLDEADGDLTRFISYLVAAIQTIHAGIGDRWLAALQSPQQPPIESILTALLNDISHIEENFLLVLDDYHRIDSPPVDETLAFLIEHQPPQMHILISTREDPSLPLARLRVRGQFTELRAADLRFTASEAAEFLNQAMGLNLSLEDVTGLEARTEGWIAGLQLAALSIRSREDIAGFIQAFTGSHRFVLDYLVEEVLQHQTELVRSFLLQTAILNQFCALLCNAVTEREDGKEMLDFLERSNLFLIPLDDQRRWYRYHHLFADVLKAHLIEEMPERVSDLHRRASAWCAQNEFLPEAIGHALEAKDFNLAANMIEQIWQEMDRNYQYTTWLGWVNFLPEDIVRSHPVICAGCAWALMGLGELDACESRLQDAERWLENADQPSKESPLSFSNKQNQGMVVVDKVEYESLPVSISTARAYRALAIGDISATKMYARQSMALHSEDTAPHHTQAIALLGIAEFASGNLQAAEQELLKFQELMWKVNDLASAIGITFVLANIKLIQGNLREAFSTYQQSLQLAMNRGASFFIGVSELHRGLGQLLCEQNDLEAAAKSLLTAQEMGEKGATTGWTQRLFVAKACLKESQGDLEGALALLDEAEKEYISNPLPDPPVAALKARLWIKQGRLNETFSWVAEHKLSPDDELSYIHEFEHLTLARALIARYKSQQMDEDIDEATGLLARLLHEAEKGGRKGSVIEILILQSLAFNAQNDLSNALATLERSLAMAEPEGYVRIFVDEGSQMAELLSIAAGKGIRLGYLNSLLTAFAAEPKGQQSSTSIPNPSSLVVPLSSRELEVLELIAQGLSNQEICKRLYLALDTVKGHNRRIFEKLQVNRRTEAIARARELGLI